MSTHQHMVRFAGPMADRALEVFNEWWDSEGIELFESVLYDEDIEPGGESPTIDGPSCSTLFLPSRWAREGVSIDSPSPEEPIELIHRGYSTEGA